MNQSDKTQYLIQADYGSIGASLREDVEHVRATVVRNIISGEYSIGPRFAVWELSEGLPDEQDVMGTIRNITEDIAREVREQMIRDHDVPSYELVSFLHERLGVSSWRWNFEPAREYA